MSFDVFLQYFDSGESAEAPKKPVLEVLRTSRHTAADQFGFYNVTFPDGVTVEFSARGLESDGAFSRCAFHLRALGDPLVNLIFEIAHVSKMAIMPAMEGSPVILVRDDIRQHLPSALLQNLTPFDVRSPAELRSLLERGFDARSR